MKRRFRFMGVECAKDGGAFHSTKTAGTGATGTEISGKKTKIVKFPKCEPLNRKFWKFWRENLLKRKFPVRNFRFEYTSRGFSLNSDSTRIGKRSWILVIFQGYCLLVDSFNNEFLTS